MSINNRFSHGLNAGASHRGAVRSDLLIPGFDDAVQDGQKVFRKVLTAMSEPGRIQTLDLTETGAGLLTQSSWQLALTLFDGDTRIWLSPTLVDDEAVVSNLRFHCQCPMVSEPSEADFVLALADELPVLKAFNWGCSEYPDQSTTLVVQIDGSIGNNPAADSTGCKWLLTGPGIETERGLMIDGLTEEFCQDLINSRQRFPLGVDCVFCADDQLAALPRSTEISELDLCTGDSQSQEAN